LDGRAEYGDLDAMADAYATAIRHAHPGPYRVCGFSLGGYLAACVAQRLEEDGKAVELVGVMDWDARQSVSPAAQRDGLVRLTVAAYRFVQQQTGILQPLPDAELHDAMAGLVERVIAEPDGGGDVFFDWVEARDLITNRALAGAVAQQMKRIERHCRLITSGLPLPRFAAPLYLWRASQGFGSDLASWGHGAAIDREFLVDGDHHSLVRPAVLEAIGAQLSEALDATSAARSGWRGPRAVRA